MTNPNDHWRHQTSAAPHSAPHDVQTPGLPLQAGQSTSFNSSSDADASYAAGNPGQPGGGLLTMAVVTLIFAGPIFGTVYPLSAGAALLAGLVVNGVLHVAMPGLASDARLPFALLAAAIVFWTVSRRDHRLAAAVPGYRLARHVARLVLIGTFVAVTSLNEFNGGSWPRSVAQLRVLLGDPRLLPTAAVVAIIAHLVLTRANGLRERWHILLQVVQLRPHM